MTRFNIARFSPANWDTDIVGNETIKEHFKSQIRALRFDGLSEGTNTLISGAFGTGKSSTFSFFARCLLCEALDPETLNPTCEGRCATCRDDVARYGEQGLTRHSLESKFNYMPIDCMMIEGVSELRERIRYMQDFDGIRIVHLEEITRLAHRGLDEMLLAPLTDLNFMWVATGAHLTNLDPAFLERFPVKLVTTLPELPEMSGWLVRLCQRSNITFEPEAIVRLAERSNYICRRALKPLVYLNAQPTGHRHLTVEFVEAFVF